MSQVVPDRSGETADTDAGLLIVDREPASCDVRQVLEEELGGGDGV